MDLSKLLSTVIGVATGKKDSLGSRKWLAVLAPCVLHFSGYPVPREMWAAVAAYVLGQSYVDAKTAPKV